MMNAVRFSKSPVTMLTYAQASSMSGVVLQCADKRVLMPDCEFMLHHGSIYIENDSVRARSAIENNDRACKRMLQIFANRAKIGPYFLEKECTDAKIQKFFDDKLSQKGDWYPTAEEAVYYGLADGILGDKGFETIAKIRKGSKYRERV